MKVIYIGIFLLCNLYSNDIIEKHDSSSHYIRELYHIAADYIGAVPSNKKKEVYKKLMDIENFNNKNSLRKKVYITKCILDLKNDLKFDRDFNLDEVYLDNLWSKPPKDKKHYFRTYTDLLKLIYLEKLAALNRTITSTKNKQKLLKELNFLEKKEFKTISDIEIKKDYFIFINDMKDDLKNNREINIDISTNDEELRRNFIRWGWVND